MKILAFDTTGENASVAIYDEEKNLYRLSSDDTMNHLKGLLPMTKQLLKDTGLRNNDITHIAVSVGPGSFTGIRIGVATAKTLAQALGIQVIPVSTLASFLAADKAAVLMSTEKIKHEAEDMAEILIPSLVCPMIDARRQQVFAAAYLSGGSEKYIKDSSSYIIDAVIEADCYKVDEFLAQVYEMAKEKDIHRVVFYGNGCDSYSSSITKAQKVAGAEIKTEISQQNLRYQDASFVAILGAELAKAGVIFTYNEVKPIYLRKAEAERKLAANLLGVKKKDKEPQIITELPPVDEVITYRFACVEDIQALAKLDALCFAKPWSENSFKGDMSGAGGFVYVVAENSKSEIIGFAGITYVLDQGDVNRVAVNPLYRGRGIGDKMMNMLLTEIESKGITEVTLEVSEANRSAIALYKNHGFKVEGKRNNYYAETGENALIMWKHGKNE